MLVFGWARRTIFVSKVYSNDNLCFPETAFIKVSYSYPTTPWVIYHKVIYHWNHFTKQYAFRYLKRKVVVLWYTIIIMTITLHYLHYKKLSSRVNFLVSYCLFTISRELLELSFRVESRNSDKQIQNNPAFLIIKQSFQKLT